MLDILRIWIAVGISILGLLVMTAAVYGMIWMPALYNSIHAAGKTAYMGVIPIIIAVAMLGDWTWGARAVLIVLFLILTTPVAGHAIVQAAYLRGEPLSETDRIDESQRLGEAGPHSDRPAGTRLAKDISVNRSME